LVFEGNDGAVKSGRVILLLYYWLDGRARNISHGHDDVMLKNEPKIEALVL